MNVALIWDHLSLVLSALILAVGVGVPLGLLAYLFPRFGKAILWVVDLIQTVPALALLGIIMVTSFGDINFLCIFALIIKELIWKH